jgi:peptidyl-prolyl cis-trans isomerase C
MRNGHRTKCCFMLLTGIMLAFSPAGVSTAGSDIKNDSAGKGGEIVARVNGQPIYRETLAPFAEQELKKFRKFGMSRKTSPEVMKQMDKRALDRIIDEVLLVQESQQIKIDDIDERVDEEIRKLEIKYGGEKKFNDYLASKKLTMDELRDNIRKRIYVNKYLEEKGIRNPVVPEEEIKKYYEETKNEYRRDEYVRASHILIKVDENASQEEIDAARKQAVKVREEIMNGRDFADAAREYSDDARAENGGNLNYITRGYMPPEFDSAAFPLKKGEVSDVVRTKFGFHIIKVNDRKPGGIPTYDEMKDFLGKYLQEELSKKKLLSHMEELKTKAKIEVLIN